MKLRPHRSHPHLYQINTWPWLEMHSRRAGRPIALGGVPDAEWDRLSASGFDLVYLMGIWKRSAIGRDIARENQGMFSAYDAALPGWRPQDVVGSAYCITGYEPDPRIGTFDDLDAVREKLHARGMRLIVDFIPNHVAFDHPWLTAHPDRFVTAPEPVFRRTPGEFRAIALPTGEVRYVACGRDPYFPPWTDVAQLNYSNPDTQAAMIDALKGVARHADGVRCDMAMLVLSDIFTRTWAHLAGPAPREEFWRKASSAVPDCLLLAEVYWDLERRVQQLGFHFTYDKTLYDRMLLAHVEDVRRHLTADAEYQRRSARFIENHDEPRSAAAFGERVTAAAVAMSTLPGLRFYHDGQFEGRRVRVPVQLGGFGDEPIDARLAAFYERLLAAVDEPIFHDGEWRLRDVARIDDSSRQILAWQWRAPDDWRLVVVNLGTATAQASVSVQDDLPDGDRLVFDDWLDGHSYEWHRADLLRDGLYVRLAPGQAHLFSLRPQRRGTP